MLVIVGLCLYHMQVGVDGTLLPVSDGHIMIGWRGNHVKTK